MKSSENIQADLDVCREIVVRGHQIAGPLWHRPGRRLIVEPGSAIVADPEALRQYEQTHPPGFVGLLQIQQCRGAIVEGGGGLIVPEDPSYREADGRPGQHRHAITVNSSEDTVLRDLLLNAGNGDGITVGDGTHFDKAIREPSRDTQIERVIAEDCGRCGLAVSSCAGLLVRHSRFGDQRRPNAIAAVDIEPNRPDQSILHAKLDDCRLEKPRQYGLNVQMSRRPRRIELELHGCRLEGGQKPALQTHYACAAPYSFGLQVADCEILSRDAQPLVLSYLAFADVKIRRGRIGRLAGKPQSDICLSWNPNGWLEWPGFDNEDVGNVLFDDVRVPEDCKVYWHPTHQDKLLTGVMGRLIRGGSAEAERVHHSGLWLVPR